MTAAEAELARIRADREAARLAAAQVPKEEVARADDVDADGVPARLYVPAGPAGAYDRGLIVHVHGGGFVFNDVEVHDGPARRLANRTGRAVLSVDYRLAPEHPFPAAVDDVDRALAWAAERTDRLVVHGDSAGANLALVGALRDPGRVRAVVLVYPFLDASSSLPSYEETGGSWERDEAQWYWRHYLGGQDRYADPEVAPLHSTRLSELPPTLVLTAEDDVARDDGEHLVERLRAEGVRVQASRVLGVPHGFWRMPDFADANDLAMRQTAGFLDLVGV